MTAFQLLTLIIAGLAFVVAVISLTWQVVAWRLTGSVVSVDLLAGVIIAGGVAAGPVKEFDPAVFISQGASEFLFVVRARNVGRTPVNIDHWTVKSDTGWGYSLGGAAWNPSLPHRLEPGAAVDFRVPMAEVRLAMQAARGDGRAAKALSGEVTLGTGQTRKGPRRTPGSWFERA